MNHPTLPLRSRPMMSPVTRGEPPLPLHTHDTAAMIAYKICYAICFFAAAASVTDDAEWRYFGGLLVGAMLSALAGLSLLLLPGKAVPRQIIQARLLANGMFGIGLGACLIYGAGLRGWHTGPMFTVGIAFLSGLFGVGLIKIAEPAIMRRIASKIDSGSDAPPPAPPYNNEPPTVKIGPPDSKP